MRRLITIPACLALTVLVTALFPVLIIAALLLSALPATRGAVSTLLFLTGYLWCETIGILCAPYIWLRYRNPARQFRANFAMQCWWANALKVLAEKFFQLKFVVHGRRALDGGPALMLPRHASIADTVLPVTYFARPQGTHLRYVLKRELLFDPCLDIYGNRLPNLFVDRSGQDSEQAVAGVRDLTRTLGSTEGVLIYPEGTRFSRAKHQALRAKANMNPELNAQLDRWPDLLPPRLGGTLAMLQANPGKDLLFLAHVGFEGSSHFKNLINGSWRKAQVHLAFWRVPFAEIPTELSALKTFLFSQWDQMQDTVRRLQKLSR